MKLNLGCGTHHKEGYINVDKHAPADVIFDLENTDVMGSVSAEHIAPDYYDLMRKGHWPWENNSVDEVIFYHSLEHMGATAEGFFHITKELYRVCKNDAEIIITVPHPRHDDFLNDPTHVRIITPNIMALFSKRNNDEWAKVGNPNTPLALQLGVNFDIVSCDCSIDEAFVGFPEKALRDAMYKNNNVIKFFTIKMKVVK